MENGEPLFSPRPDSEHTSLRCSWIFSTRCKMGIAPRCPVIKWMLQKQNKNESKIIKQ